MSSTSPQKPPADALITTKSPPTQSVLSSFKIQQSGSTRRQHPVDARLDRLIKDVLPPAPYLLRLRNPSAQYHGRERYFWRKDTPFKEDEEELQYLTFRPTHDGTILFAHGQWDDGNGNIAPKEFLSSQNSSRQTPSTGQVPKKKITLADYAKMDKSKTGIIKATGEAEKTFQEFSEASKMDTGKLDMEVQHKTHGGSSPKGAKEEGKATERALKRSADTMNATSDTGGVVHDTATPPLKKTRVNDQPIKGEEAEKNQQNSIKSVDSKSISAAAPKPGKHPKPMPAAEPKSQGIENLEREEDKGLAPNSKAAHLEILSAKKPPLHGLPPMLSPTLPAEIEEELAKRTPGLRGGLASSRVSSRSPSIHSKDSKREASTGPKAKLSSDSLAPSTPKLSSRDPKQITSAPRHQQEDDGTHSNAESVVSKRSKIITLKIKKRTNRETLMKYLKLPPTPNRRSTKTTVKSDSIGIASDTNSSKVPRQSKSFGIIKSPRENESSGNDEPLSMLKSNKRRATDLDYEDIGRGNAKRMKGSKPASQDISKVSPSPQQKTTGKAVAVTPTQTLPNAAQKSHLNVKSTAMQRTASQESVATPARDNTPNANGHKPDSPELREWKNNIKHETNRLIKLATEIKHDSDVYLRNLMGREYEESRPLGCILATEATLCFMLAAIVTDELGRSSKAYSDPRLWKSTHHFLQSLSSLHAKKFQYVYGFLKQLEGVVCDTIAYQHDMRGEAILREYNRLKNGEAAPPTVRSPNSYIAENWAFLKESQETRQQARSAWREGQMSLFDQDLEREFPKTWSGRRDFASRGKGRDPVTLNHYGKEGFALPLGVNSTALDAVNFGLAFLKELSEKENIKWEPKLVL